MEVIAFCLGMVTGEAVCVIALAIVASGRSD